MDGDAAQRGPPLPGADPGVASVAELRRAKAAAEAANEAKTRYLVGVSHEIRSPLNAIYGYAQLLERDGAVAPAEAGAVIRRSAEHLLNLVEGLLEISRIESGVVKLQFQVVDIRGLLAGVVEMFRPQAAAKGLDLALEVADALPAQVKADEKRLRQILINLVGNAVKYTQGGGVAVRVGYRTQVADIVVADTGPGIAPDELERVFEPFARGTAAEAQGEPGLGLGLAITRTLARVMGGDVSAASVPGEGSRFRLRLMLPAPMRAVGEAGGARRIRGYRGARRTVLVVDDDPAQGRIVAALLRPLGFAVHVAGGGAEGLALAERHPPDVALLDIQMPGLDGWAVARRLRAARGQGLRIVMVSADAHEAAGPGGGVHDDFVAKPVDLDALLAAIGRQLDLRWDEAPPAVPPAPPAPSPLPAEAGPFLQRLRQLARIGHVRGVEDALADLARAVPAAAPLVATLRAQAGDFDLPALLRTMDDAEHPRP